VITSVARDRVRMQLDVDSTELPDVHLDWFLQDGFDATIGVETTWPFYQVTSTIALVGGTGAYNLPTNWREIRAARIEDPDYQLVEVDHDSAETEWSEPIAYSGNPIFWSLWASQIHLWPAPASSTTLYVRGYRNPTDWLASGSNEMDCDKRLQPAVLMYALSRAYHQQEDEVLSADYMNQWAAKVESARADIMRERSFQPRVLNRGLHTRSPWTRARWAI